MSYDDLAAPLLAAPVEPGPEPVLPGTPSRRLRDALEPLATQGWWSRAVNDRLSAHGLGFFDGYVWGRAAALGEPAPAVVVAAFGVFEPALLTAVYEHGRGTASRGQVLEARSAGAEDAVAAVVDPASASEVADPLLDALLALDGMGRPLFSALRALPLPASPAGRLWRAAELAREHRGDGHLAVCVHAGLDAVTANILTELWVGYPLGEYTGSRGFGPAAIDKAVSRLAARGWVSDGVLTEQGRAARTDIEASTDASQAELVHRLGAGLDAIVDTAATLSSAIVAAGSFPKDPRKRACG